MKPIICAAAPKNVSHSGAPPQGGEPGIHGPRPVVMDSGLAPELGPARLQHQRWSKSATADFDRARPGMTLHMIRNSKSLYQWPMGFTYFARRSQQHNLRRGGKFIPSGSHGL